MLEQIQSWPYAFVFAFFMMGAALRSSTTYAIGRYARYLSLRPHRPNESAFARKIREFAAHPRTASTSDMLRRRGWIVIPFAFVTIGVQSFVMLSAGLIGLRYPFFALAALPGWIAWATIYTTIGFAAWTALLSAAAGSPVGIAVICTMLVSLGIFLFYRARSRKTKKSA